MMGPDDALVPVPKDSPTTGSAKQRLIVALTKWFVDKYGMSIAKGVLDKVSLKKLRELAQREGLPDPTTTINVSSGGAILLVLLFALASSKTRR